MSTEISADSRLKCQLDLADISVDTSVNTSTNILSRLICRLTYRLSVSSICWPIHRLSVSRYVHRYIGWVSVDMLTNTSVEGSQNTHDPIMLNVSQLTCLLKRVYIGVKTCEVFLCFVAIVRVRVYYADCVVFFVSRHWWVPQGFTPRMSRIVSVRVFYAQICLDFEPVKPAFHANKRECPRIVMSFLPLSLAQHKR